MEATHIKIQTVLMETIIQDILNVSISVELYQKYVHIKACVAMESAPKVWVKVKMTFILHLGGSTILWLKGIIVLIYFHAEKNDKLVARNVRDKTLGMFPTSITISIYTREVHRHYNAPCDYTHTGCSGKPYVRLDIS
jgi:hypothetical protein